ncbi:hypothetical protein MTP03_39510 [Tsukamurella sp. PLM1]|nr:hypothetical protein MTP03_39510 [Tsukamurella sp. PLM1]
MAVATSPPPADPPLRMPAAHTFSRRAELLTFGMIGRLEASADWHAICREWIYGESLHRARPRARRLARFAPR